MYTHFFSAHPLATKKGVLIGLFLRALRLCSNEHLATEIDHISKAFTRLQYPQYIIQQTLTTSRSRFLHPTARERPRTKYHLKLPCHPALQTLRPALSKIGVSTSYSSSNTLRSHLVRNGPSRPTTNELPGVYKIECEQCPEGVYYGETGVSLAKRKKDHLGYISSKKDSSSLVCHMRENPGHSFDVDAMNLVYICCDEDKRKLVESALITTTSNCNKRPGEFPLCKLTAPVVVQSLQLALKAIPSIHHPSLLPSSTSNPATPATISQVSATPAVSPPLNFPAHAQLSSEHPL